MTDRNLINQLRMSINHSKEFVFVRSTNLPGLARGKLVLLLPMVMCALKKTDWRQSTC